MHILVTNDDGILAPGIVALAEAMAQLGKVTVIAPDRNNTGASSKISLETPLRVTEIRPNWFQLNGSPADCSKLALSGFLNEEPDMVVSGINDGQNLGDDVIYSGTFAAALEGRYLGMPSVGFSLAGHSANFEAAAKYAQEIVKKIIRQKLDPEVTLNVNIPDIPYEEIKGMQVTRQGGRHFSQPLKPTFDGRNKEIYWLGETGDISDGGVGTDFHAIAQGYVSITPMQVDLTDHQKLNSVADWLASGD